MYFLKYIITVIVIIIVIKIVYAEMNKRNSTTTLFKYIISDGVQDFAIES